MKRLGTHHVIKRLIPPLTAWAVSKVLEVPKVQRSIASADRTTAAKKKSAMKSLTRAARNAQRNRGMLAAGAAACALGITLVAQATRKK